MLLLLTDRAGSFMELNIALAIVGGLVLLLSLSAGFVKSTVYPVSEPMAAVLVGILVGPLVFDLLALEHWGDPKKILQEVARLTIAVSVMGIALRLPKRYFRKHLRSMLAILVPGLLLMWLVSGLLVYGLLGVSFWLALLIGAVVTPTDPVLGGTVVTGETAEQKSPAVCGTSSPARLAPTTAAPCRSSCLPS